MTQLVRAEKAQIEVLKQQLAARREAIAGALAKHMDPVRFERTVLQAAASNPDLLSASRSSLIREVMRCAALGLEPSGPVGGAYLMVTRGKRGPEAQLITDYRGEIALAIRSGHATSVSAEIVYEHDQYDLVLGTDRRIEHRPALRDPGEPVLVYAVAELRGGGTQFAFHRWDPDITGRIKRARGKVWAAHPEAMARKTAVRSLCNLLVRSPDYIEQVMREEAAERGAPVPSAVEETDADADPAVDDGDALLAELVVEREPGEEG